MDKVVTFESFDDLSITYSAIDACGNTYCTGTFRNTMDLDPGPDTDMASASGAYDLFLIKLAPNGDYLWGFTTGGSQNDHPVGLAIDVQPGNGCGNPVLIGNFAYSINVDPINGAHQLTGANGGYQNAFALKLDELGNHIWSRSWGGSDELLASRLHMDASGSLYITGKLKQTADLDPGPGTDIRTATNSHYGYLLKLDATGNHVWSKTIDDLGFTEFNSVLPDASGNLYIAGKFFGTITPNSSSPQTQISSNGDSDAIIKKIDANGNLIWTKTLGGTASDGVMSITVNQQQEVIVAGFFRETVDFDPGQSIQNRSSKGGIDMFILGLNANGDYKWVYTEGGSGNDYPTSLLLDPSGNIYAMGIYANTVTFGSNNTLSDNGIGHNVYLLNLDLWGNFKCVRNVASLDPVVASGLVWNNNQQIFQGNTKSSLSLEFDNGTTSLNATSSCNGFIAWVNVFPITLVNESNALSRFSVYPNPTQDQLFFNAAGNTLSFVTLFDMQGRSIMQAAPGERELNLRQLAAGVYFLHLATPEGVAIQKVVKE
ncbi:MAG: T9SS type A sorting domain-containing protein [Salibacteraceae bacterium]